MSLLTDAAAERTGHACPACDSDDVFGFYELDEVPGNSCLLFASAEAARACPKGRIDLHACRHCGFVFNAGFDAAKVTYSSDYEETQGFSPTFSKFHTDLGRRLIAGFGLESGRVIEIGCGKGEFLLLLSQLGRVEGLGIDPSAIPERIAGADGAERVTLLPRYLSGVSDPLRADAIICKMTLEHIPDVRDFVHGLRTQIAEDTRPHIFFQVPDAGRVFGDLAFEDVYHEHCSYFTADALSRLFAANGFDVNAVRREFDGQYLALEGLAGPAEASADRISQDTADTLAAAIRFGEEVEGVKGHWHNRIVRARQDGKSVVLWGSGSKGVSFLTSLGLDDEIAAVVDINPNRQGHHMAGTGHPIVGPEALGEIDPGLVIVMNRIYTDEIAADLGRLGLSPEIAAL